MSLESKVFFPLARIVFLILGVLVLVATIGSVGLAAYYGHRIILPGGAHVAPKFIAARLTPFGQAEKQDGQASTDPFGRAMAPLDTLEMKFRGAANLIERMTQKDASAQREAIPFLDEKLGQAVANGDNADDYLANATQVLDAVENPRLRKTALDIYHNERMAALAKARENQALAMTRAGLFGISAAIGLGYLLVLSLLMAVLAVERNTRPPSA